MDKNNHFIKKYIRKLGINQSEAARQIGTSRQRISQVISSERVGPALAVKIWRWSQGALRLQDMRPDIWGE